MKPSVVAAESHLKHHRLTIPFWVNTFEFKNLAKNLINSLKEKSFFKDLRKEVDTGANGTQNYVLKKGMNKNSIATTKQ